VVVVAGPESYVYFPKDIRAFTWDPAYQTHCQLLDNRTDLTLRIVSAAVVPLQGGGGFSVVERTPGTCGSSESLVPEGSNLVGPCASSPVPAGDSPASFCHFALQAPPRDGINHRAKIVVPAESLCTDRVAELCTDLPADKHPTPQTPVRIQWPVVDRTVVACWAIDRPTDGDFWLAELRGECPDETPAEPQPTEPEPAGS